MSWSWMEGSLFDEGAAQFEWDEREKEQDRMDDIREDRKRRMHQLEGRYVVCTTGQSSGHLVFYQNQRVNDGGYWTRYLSNAFGYTSLQAAKEAKSKFRFGNPRIAIVKNGVYQWV